MSTPTVTVVVCSFDGEKTLAATLLALADQKSPELAEVIVVDDGSSDATSDVARSHGARVIRHEQNAGLAAARNTGWQAASTPLVAFTDDDCRPDPLWIDRLIEAHGRHPDAGVIGGSVRGAGDSTFTLRYLQASKPLAPLEAALLDDDGLVHRLALYVRRSASPRTPEGERVVSSVVGANMMFPWEVLSHYGGFDPRFRFGGEEEDFCRRLVLVGEELVFVPDAIVEHDFEPGIRDTLRRSRAYGRGNARMYLKHPGLRPTLYPLPAAVATLVAIAVTRRSVPAALAAVALPPLLFSRWLGEAARTRDVEKLAYPYVQLAQEASGNLGLVRTWYGERKTFADGAPPS